MKLKLISGGYDSLYEPVLITYWTLIHFFSGIIGFVALDYFFKFNDLTNFIIFFILQTLYEIKDYYFTYIEKPSEIYLENTIANSIADSIACALGWFFAYCFIGSGKSLKFLIIITILQFLSMFIFFNLRLG